MALRPSGYLYEGPQALINRSFCRKQKLLKSGALRPHGYHLRAVRPLVKDNASQKHYLIARASGPSVT